MLRVIRTEQPKRGIGICKNRNRLFNFKTITIRVMHTCTEQELKWKLPGKAMGLTDL